MLRDHLLESLSNHPGQQQRTFHLHVLESSARRTEDGEPFPHARGKKPKIYVRDVFVLLSEEREEETTKVRLLVTGIESSIFMFPQTNSVILYICKIDSTGHASHPSPTHRLVHSFLRYFCEKKKLDAMYESSCGAAATKVGVKNLWIQLFARSQSEYLFLGSKLWKGKKVLSDIGLCSWWKRCLNEAVEGVGVEVGKWYVLPGQSREEAEDAIRNYAGVALEGWEYGHPYARNLPCPQNAGDLGRIIPYFDDDPKSRFLDELKVDKTLSKVGVDEFWERMSFRQECITAVTGFFTVVLGFDDGEGSDELTGWEVSWQVIERVKRMLENTLDFSTREAAMRATEVVESAIQGFCDGHYDTIYGRVMNSARDGKVLVKRERESHVTQLVVRRKKKGRLE